jgi:hypothetical protein
MPTSFPLTVSDSDFTAFARLRLSLPAGLANDPAPRCDCGATILPVDSDHPLTCACLALRQTSRHDLVTTSWRCIATRAGVHTMAEPHFRFFPAPSSPLATPSAEPALTSSSGGCAFSLPVLVTDAPALAPAVAPVLPNNPALCPCPGAPFRSPDRLGAPPSLAHRARWDVMFVFPRRLMVVDVSVIHPAAAYFAGGAARTPLGYMSLCQVPPVSSSTRRLRPFLGALRAPPGFAAAAQDASKQRAYWQVSSALPFVPISLESFRRLGAPALTLLGDVADQAVQAGGPGLSRAAFISGALRKLSVALCRGNASLCWSGAHVATRAAGRPRCAVSPSPRLRLFRPVTRPVCGLGCLVRLSLRCVALLFGLFVRLQVALFPAGGPFLPSLYVILYM